MAAPPQAIHGTDCRRAPPWFRPRVEHRFALTTLIIVGARIQAAALAFASTEMPVSFWSAAFSSLRAPTGAEADNTS